MADSTRMSALPPYHLHASLGYQLSLAARLQERRLEEGLKALGLTRTTWCILLAIGNESLTQPSEIARFVGIDRTATSRALRQMETAGLAVRGLGRGDGRTRSVALTDHGKRLLDRGTPLARDNNTIMEDRLSPSERDHLMLLLRKTHAGEDASLTHF